MHSTMSCTYYIFFIHYLKIKKKQKNTEHQNMYQVLVMCTKNKIQINQSIYLFYLFDYYINKSGMWNVVWKRNYLTSKVVFLVLAAFELGVVFFIVTPQQQTHNESCNRKNTTGCSFLNNLPQE